MLNENVASDPKPTSIVRAKSFSVLWMSFLELVVSWRCALVVIDEMIIRHAALTNGGKGAVQSHGEMLGTGESPSVQGCTGDEPVDSVVCENQGRPGYPTTDQVPELADEQAWPKLT